MTAARGEPGRLDPETWRRIGAVLDRVHDVDPSLRAGVLEEACRAEGVSIDVVRPYLDAGERSDRFPERLDPAVLNDALHAHADASPARLAPGTRLGPYEILSLIGIGGMGEVYRARDTRLNRSVALKRLSAHLAANPEGRQRFEREAHAMSTVNHPHICTLHDVGEHEGMEFIVMELVKGETLAARLQRGALPMTEALRVAAEIAAALAAAHRQGIVHRDLKPANVMLTAHGVKLLDFGLAALRSSRGPIEHRHDQVSTGAGTILGTLQYMAPEQLQGKPVDGRADLFALGAILYEMLAGRKIFEADTAAGVVAAVLADSPPLLTGSRPDVPAVLDWTIAQCLSKDVEERWHSADDLARQLRWIAASRTVGDPESRRSARRGMMIHLATLVAALVLIAAGAAWYFLGRHQQVAVPLPYRFEIPAPAGTSYEGLFAISPDGRRLAFATTDAAGRRSLWIRPLDGLTALRLENTDGALYPFWSPDGGSLGFFAERKLKILDLATGRVRTLCDAGRGGGGTWNADGVILFADDAAIPAGSATGGLRRIPASGGVAMPIPPHEGEGRTVHAYPHFLPDGQQYLYTRLGTRDPGVYIGRLDDDEPVRILPAVLTVVTPQQVNVNGPVRATYAAGYLFYLDSSDRTLAAQAFDIERVQLTDDAVAIAEDVENLAPGLSAFDVSATGMLVYRPIRSDLVAARSSSPAVDRSKPPSVPPALPAPPPMIGLVNWPSLVAR